MKSESAGARAQRGWYHGWNIVTVSVLSGASANGLTYNCYSLFLKDWSVQLHTPISRLQIAFPIAFLISAMVSPLLGRFADKYPARTLFACGLIGIAILYIAMSLVTASWQILGLYGLIAPLSVGLAASITANAVISRWFSRHLGLALGLSSFGTGLGGVLFPPIISQLLPTVGWRLIWRGAGLLTGLIIMPLVVAVVSDRPTERHGFHYLGNNNSAAATSRRHADDHGELTWRTVVARRNFWLLVTVYVLLMLLYTGCAQNVGPYAAARGLRPQYGGLLLSVFSLSHLVSTLIVGFLADRFGNRLPLAGLAAVNATGALVLAFGSALPTVTLGYALVGASGGVFTLLAVALAVEFGAEGVGRAFGLSMLFVPIGALAPFAVAKTQEITGSYMYPLFGLAILALIAGALCVMLRERRGN